MSIQADIAPAIVESVLELLPIGLALIDADQRLIYMNPAYCASMDLPPDSFAPGMLVEDMVRGAAYRGVYGPGDPEAQVAAVMAGSRSRPGRLRRRNFNDRSFDISSVPLPGGGYVVSAVETTPLVAARAQAEQVHDQTVAALASLRIGIAAFRADGALVFSNPRFASRLALPTEHVTPGLTFSALLDLMVAHDEFAGIDGTMFVDDQRAANRSNVSAVRRVRTDGVVILVASDPLLDGGWTLTVTDISPLARAENEAQRRARLLDSVVANVPHGICVYGADRRVILINRTYNRVMAGAPLKIGDLLTDVIRRRAEAGEYGPGDPDEVYLQQMAFDISRPQMRRRRRPDGTALDVRTAPMPDGGHISVVTDVTQLVQAEAEVTRHASDMEVMLANIHHGIMLWGADRRLIASNAVASELSEHPPGLLIPGRSEDEVIDNMLQRGEWGDGEKAAAFARQLRSSDRSVPYVREVVTRSGRVLDMRSEPTPGGGWVTTYTDVTAERAAQAELRAAKEAAEAASQAKSRFLATMSHELRTPLNAVIGFSDALMREAANPSSDTIVEFSRQINDAGRELLDQINIILDVARIDSGRFDMSLDQVDIARLLRGVARQADSMAHAAEITLTTALPDQLPVLRGDERRLQQALMQLVSNAVKFTDPGGRVTIGAEASPDDGLRLFVQDSGIGIPDLDLDRVFEPFVQLDNTLARRFKGTGLGLYIAKALIEGHGGKLALRPAPAGGTIAKIRLPADRLIW